MRLGSDLLGFGISPAADRQHRYRLRECDVDATAHCPVSTKLHVNYITSSRRVAYWTWRPRDKSRTIALAPN